jgi:hypothetical protein
MWNMKCMIIPAVNGATGVVTKGLKENLEPYQEKVNRFTTKNGYTKNITHNKDSPAD